MLATSDYYGLVGANENVPDPPRIIAGNIGTAITNRIYVYGVEGLLSKSQADSYGLVNTPENLGLVPPGTDGVYPFVPLPDGTPAYLSPVDTSHDGGDVSAGTGVTTGGSTA